MFNKYSPNGKAFCLIYVILTSSCNNVSTINVNTVINNMAVLIKQSFFIPALTLPSFPFR